MNAEEAKVGCFQIVLMLLLGINYVIVAMSHALPVFHNYTPKFYCQVRWSMVLKEIAEIFIFIYSDISDTSRNYFNSVT